MQNLEAGNPVPVSTDEVCETLCEPCPPSCCCILKRKLQLHCIYARRACCCRYVSLPYTAPTSIFYNAPGLNGGGTDAACPPGAATAGPQGNLSSYMFGGAPPYAADPRRAFVR